LIANLRDYQRKSIEDTYQWLALNPGNPCIVAPTGSGKSWIIAGLCEDILSRWPKSRILILSHVKELLVQDAEKLLIAWPEAPIGIYSAGLGQKNVNTVTVAGIQSIWRQAEAAGRVDLVIVDEAHSINNESQGRYRKFIEDLRGINPNLRVIGLTATPYRLGQGMVTEGKDALFDGLIESISIEELVSRGYLARLRSKFTAMRIDTEGVRVQGGDFLRGELEKHVNTEENNAQIVEETLRRAEGRRAWLVFCTGVDHAEAMRSELLRQGVSAGMVTGATPREERDQLLADFKAGRLRALTNVNVLTTGFDYPDIDVLVMARPTLSPGLYMQMAGRGMRVKSGEYQDCLVLDFAGNISRHGPVTAVEPPRRQGQRKGKPVVKECPQCSEAVAAGTRVCPCCGFVFPEPEKQTLALHEDQDIMGEPTRMAVREWKWLVVKSRKNGTPMIRVDFYGTSLLSPTVPLFLCLLHGGYAAQKAAFTLRKLTGWGLSNFLNEGEENVDEETLKRVTSVMNDLNTPPAWIEYCQRGKYKEITQWGWEEVEKNEAAV
jgi:DNA repair protein RadD